VDYIELLYEANTDGGDGYWQGDVHHLYQSLGDYPVQLVAINQFHDQKDIFLVSISDIQCDSPEVSILGK